MGHRRGKLVASTDPNYKSRIQDAPVDAHHLQERIFQQLQEYTRYDYVFSGSCNANFIVQVAQQSLKDHSRGMYVPRRDFSKSQQLYRLKRKLSRIGQLINSALAH